MKTRHGDYEKLVKFEVWSDYKVYVVFTEDLMSSRISRYDSAGVAGESDTEALFTRGSGGYGHLFFKPNACARVIAHECWHALWWMFKWAGVTEFDNETVAYHLGHLVGVVSDFQAKVLGVKSSTRMRPHEPKNENSQGSADEVPSLQSPFDRTGRQEERTPQIAVDWSGDLGITRPTTSLPRTRGRRADKGRKV